MPMPTPTAAVTPGGPDLIWRFQELALDQARRALAEAIMRQGAAEAMLAEAMRAVALHQAQATQSSTDEAVDAFAAWLPEGRRAVRQAGEQATAAAADTASARAALSLARPAVRGEGGPAHPRPAAPGPGKRPDQE